mmetsp:Transcript_15960/g.33718  ORF Transcript_15960/g.33718 Transcript_15960/m.33718 type:complete len:94 (+) Transcript_15960:9-290(+)
MRGGERRRMRRMICHRRRNKSLMMKIMRMRQNEFILESSDTHTHTQFGSIPPREMGDAHIGDFFREKSNMLFTEKRGTVEEATSWVCGRMCES